MTLDHETLVADPRKVAGSLRYRIVYIPHDQIKDYNACYFVIYKGK